MTSFKNILYRFLLLTCMHLSSSFVPGVKYSLNNPTKYKSTQLKVTGLDNEVEDEKKRKYKVYINLATGKPTNLKFSDAYSKANTELKMSWGW